jgi:hypothetical protein
LFLNLSTTVLMKVLGVSEYKKMDWRWVWKNVEWSDLETLSSSARTDGDNGRGALKI